MPLASGSRIGSYEIESLIGAGGMGEVYRARDHKLGRLVALKILSEVVAGDPDRLARFRREAQLLASLNHPNVAQIYGFEDAGPTGSGQAGIQALVLELVEGPTLAERIAAGPIPVDETLAIARQIADAVASAHDCGIIHRDLKPANVKVSEANGAVKVLDFGLAKALVPESSGAMSATSSPTLTARATQIGVILGTAAYMAPEQARGRAVDRRADLWAFGVVLYEMLTGRRAFDGPEISDVLASVLKDTPPLDALPPDVPHSVRRLLRRTLEKDPARRLDSMAAARLELDDVESTPVARDVRAPVRRVVIPAAIAAVISGVGVGAAVWYARQPAPPAVVRLALTPPADQPIGVEANHADIAITPDGSRVVYLTETGSTRAFVVRPLGQAAGLVLNKLGEHVRGVFVSPDGRWLGYQAGPTGGRRNEIRKVPIDGGATLPVCPIESNLRGSSWGPDDTIIFATNQPSAGLFRVPASGGKPEVLTTPNAAEGESDHLWPHHLPDGRHVLFAIYRQDITWDVALLSLDTKTWRVILKGGMAPRYVSTGHLLYGSPTGIRGIAFDLDRLAVAGDPIEVQGGVMTKESGAANFAVSSTGTLVYLPGELRPSASTLAWMEPNGRETPVDQPPQEYQNLRLTRDGKRAIATIGRPDQSSLWLLDLTRALQIRLTPPDLDAARPIWHPNGTEIVFSGRSAGSAKGGLFRLVVTGTGVPERLTTSDVQQIASGWTPDGRLLFHEGVPGGDADIKLLTFGSPPRVETLLGGSAVEVLPALSPDGRLLAYTLVENGPQIFVRPFPNVNDARIPVSRGPGAAPEWSSDGRELYFVIGGPPTDVVAARLESTNPVSFGKPRLIKNLRDPDNQQIRVGMPPVNGRLLRIVRAATRSAGHTEYRVVLNWTEELRARIPTR